MASKRKRVLLYPTTGTVISGGLWVHWPLGKAEPVDGLKQGDTFAVLDIYEDVVCTWLRIKYDGGKKIGWVAEKNKKKGERYVALHSEVPRWPPVLAAVLAASGCAALIGALIAIFG